MKILKIYLNNYKALRSYFRKARSRNWLCEAQHIIYRQIQHIKEKVISHLNDKLIHCRDNHVGLKLSRFYMKEIFALLQFDKISGNEWKMTSNICWMTFLIQHFALDSRGQGGMICIRSAQGRAGGSINASRHERGNAIFFHKFKEGVGNSLILKPSHAC